MTKIAIYKFKMWKKTRKDFLGFTLIELLVVISIIGILIALSFVGFNQARKSARDSKRKADLEQIRSALEIYRNDQKTYPDDFSGCSYTSLTSGTEVYMAEIPKDPFCPTQYYRYNKLNSNAYCLCAYLETLSSTVGTCNCGSAACGTDVTCNYKVTNP